MERTAEIILSEIKECLKAVSEKLSELEALQAVKEEPTPEPEPLPVEPVEPVDLDIDLPAEYQAPAPEPAPKQEETPAPIQEEVTPPEEEMPVKGPAVLDVVTRSRAWEIDMPGSPVANILSAISLNDRLLFINTLFKKDPALFQDAVKAFYDGRKAQVELVCRGNCS